MKAQSGCGTAEHAEHGGLKVSMDGHVRVPAGRLNAIRFKHFLSGLDDDERCGYLGEGGYQAALSGYTEWLSETTPVITVGWDWLCEARQDGLRYEFDSLPRTNLMLVDEATSDDLGNDKTELELKRLFERIRWREEVAGEISRRYAWPPAAPKKAARDSLATAFNGNGNRI